MVLAKNCNRVVEELMKRCLMDGFEFHGEPIRMPKHYDVVRGTFTFENAVFCSLRCAKGWLFKSPFRNNDRINTFTLYHTTVLGHTGPVAICPDVATLRAYMYDDTDGLSIEQFRQSH